MLFNSTRFILFFVVVYGLYLLLRGRRVWQNRLLLVASYYFYGSWDPRFLSLIVISTLVDFFIGRALGREPAGSPRRRTLLFTSVAVNLTILGFFKYFNFFVGTVAGVFGLLGMEADFVTLNIVLPVGISFYTFQTMSYTIDIYRGRLKPTASLLDFAVFVAFFPQLVAGPIERAANLLPQLTEPRRIKMAQVMAGLDLIIWGYFKKVVVADNAGLIADRVFNQPANAHGLDVLVGVLAFTLQIYGDFSGYSQIARGISRLMGFELMVNFRLPYFAMNPTDFWQRWHVSLSSWLRDYLYISLGGNRGGSLATYRNLMLTMLLGGLWHGAAWQFVLWGGFHGLILIIYRRFEKKPVHEDPWGGDHPIPVVLGKWALMFTLTLFGWLLFRANSVPDILILLRQLSLAAAPATSEVVWRLLLITSPLIVLEVAQYKSRNVLIVTRLPVPARAVIYALLFTFMALFGVRESLEFIYFQF